MKLAKARRQMDYFINGPKLESEKKHPVISQAAELSLVIRRDTNSPFPVKRSLNILIARQLDR